MIDRRLFLAGAVAGCFTPGSHGRAAETASLGHRAGTKGLDFGYMLNDAAIAPQSPVGAIVARDASMVVPENAMKWSRTVDAAGSPFYDQADRYVDFARTHGLTIRGHTAFWYRSIPAMAESALQGPEWRATLLARVQSIVGHYRGRVAEWDVVNEAIEPRDGQAGGLRIAPFGRPMDTGYIADCFFAAREADPAAHLFYNDYGIENADAASDTKRAAVLGLLAELQRRGAPVDALGMQSHLGVTWRIDHGKLRAFLRDVAAMGLRIRITEMDFRDSDAPGNIAARDALTAGYARAFLDTCLDEAAVKGVMCWGVHDDQSWMQGDAHMKRADGEPLRPLPYDAQLQPKPLWSAIGAAFDAAPVRSHW
ncbi:endo-1,4-beta-xylanase [Sphingomonas sp.]|uniref:endo-1,4-beta-xylanase n=1 Tax=Sphingomonas sp. TaxID=28214 RepID=UPI0031D7233C